MKTTTSRPLLAALGLLAIAPPALAAPAKLAGGPVSASGAATVKITNPNRHALKGTVSLVSAKAKSYRKAFVLKAPGGAAGGAPGAGQPGGGAPSNRWTATTSIGATFPMTVDGDKAALTQAAQQPVSCSEIGGQYRVAVSSELFDLLGPWQLGNQDGTQTQQVPRVNTLVTSGARTVTYRLKTSRAGNQISGSLIQTFSDSRYDIFTNKITFINCAGTLNFTAVPAA